VTAALRPVALAGAVAVAVALLAPQASADVVSRAVVDRVAVRFHAPETGGTARPRFVTERTLAFEARIEALLESGQDLPHGGYPERFVRSALEHDVAQQILASLADKLIADSPPDRRPRADELAQVRADVAAALLERLGGRARVDQVARAEQLDPAEVDGLLAREAMAAWYLDRAVTPLLHPTDEQLRDVYRTSAHPYRGQPFARVRAPLERWFVVERLRVAESAFLQSARARVKIVVTP